ncbi:hypothetical protein ACWGJZ_37185, partial [Streptomyces rimosus]
MTVRASGMSGVCLHRGRGPYAATDDADATCALDWGLYRRPAQLPYNRTIVQKRRCPHRFRDPEDIETSGDTMPAAKYIPAALQNLTLPVIASPMFIVSYPELVLAQCQAGIVGRHPGPSRRAGGGAMCRSSPADRWVSQ